MLDEKDPRGRCSDDRTSDSDRVGLTLTAARCAIPFPQLVAVCPVVFRSLAVNQGMKAWRGRELLQSESPVAGGVGVPVGERSHPALEPWALDNVVGDRRGRHFGSRLSRRLGELEKAIRLDTR